MHPFRAMSGYFFLVSVRTRSFLFVVGLVCFAVVIMAILSYSTLNISGYDSLGYVLNRVKGVERVNLVYFFWSIPYQALTILIPVILSSGVLSRDYESGESSIYYSYPVSWSSILFSKTAVSVVMSLIPLSIYAGLENVILGVYFASFPPVSMLLSYLTTIVAVIAIVSVTALSSVIFRSSLMSSLVVLIIFLAVMNIINLYYLITATGQPLFLLNNEISVVSEVFSEINIIPVGASGAVGPAGTFYVLRTIAYMALYASASLAVAIGILERRDAS